MSTHDILDRPDWQPWALGIAKAVSERGDCTRRRVGAVLLDTNHRIIGAGYNGTEPGGPSCLKGECPRGRHYRMPEPHAQKCQYEKSHNGVWISGDDLSICSDCHFLFKCACGKEWEGEAGCEDAVAPGSSYDTGPGTCHASHAEQNVLADVEAKHRLPGSVMYVTERPCDGCVRQIRNTTPISRVVWPDGTHLFER